MPIAYLPFTYDWFLINLDISMSIRKMRNFWGFLRQLQVKNYLFIVYNIRALPFELDVTCLTDYLNDKSFTHLQTQHKSC